MRQSIRGFIAAILFVAAAPLLGLATNVVDDAIRMTRAGVDEDTIVAFIQGERRPFEVTADDMIALTNARVSKKVVQALLDRSGALKQPASQPADQKPAEETPQGESQPAPAAESPVVFAMPSFIPDYLWDPFWYIPRLDTKSGASVVKPAVTQNRPPKAAAPPRKVVKPYEHGAAEANPAAPSARPSASGGARPSRGMRPGR